MLVYTYTLALFCLALEQTKRQFEQRSLERIIFNLWKIKIIKVNYTTRHRAK